MSLRATRSFAANQATAPGCFHCGALVPLHANFSVTIDGAARPMCCHGCEAVARAIVDAGLGEYYQHRTASAETAREPVPDFLRHTALYDLPEIQKSFVQADGENVRDAALILEGITCPACVWLNEQHLARLPGVLSVHINYATHRAHVRWDARHLRLSNILQAISHIGYRAHPYDPARHQQKIENDRRQLLRRLGVAGILGMQVMTLSIALYVGHWSDAESNYRTLFHWISLLLTLPVLLYAAQPFFRSAWNDLRHFRAGMDVPVSLGMGSAFLASTWTTLTGEGTIYFDSVCLFAFFLLSGRYFELAAQKRATDASEALVLATPAMATRLVVEAGLAREETIAVAELKPGDRIRIRPGDPIPTDSMVEAGRSSVDESLLTGEHLPVAKSPGQFLTGGTLNIESPLTACVLAVGPDTVLSSIVRLLDRAVAEKPRLTKLADRVASVFVTLVLVIAGLVAIYWWTHNPSIWLSATIATLVVACPCALSLATPAVITAATGQLTRLGVLVTRGYALETLAVATHFLFDKTGTLTRGKLQLRETRIFASLSAEQCLAIACALEQGSEHPIARALINAREHVSLEASEIINTPGSGICGRIKQQQYFLGTAAYLECKIHDSIDPELLQELTAEGDSVTFLADAKGLLAAFRLNDELRPGARELIEALHRQGKFTELLTGDHHVSARRVAETLGIRTFASNLTPAAKLTRIKDLQQTGAVVAMVGDGVNDAPVLAAAQVSIAMGGGAAIAAANADMILLSPEIQRLVDGLAVAHQALTVIRQNLAWAVAYNLLAIPIAASGTLSPWMAALGMSASSLLVVLNALRVTRSRTTQLSPNNVVAVG